MAITYGPIEAVKKKPAGRKKKGQQPQDEDDLSEEVIYENILWRSLKLIVSSI